MYKQINPSWDGKPLKLYFSENGVYENYNYPPPGILVKFKLNKTSFIEERYGIVVSMGGFYPTDACRTVIVEFARGLQPRQLHIANNIDEWFPLDSYEAIPQGVRMDIEIAEVKNFWEELNIFKNYYGDAYVMRGKNSSNGIKYLILPEEGKYKFKFTEKKDEATVFPNLTSQDQAALKARFLTRAIADYDPHWGYDYCFGHLMAEAVEVA